MNILIVFFLFTITIFGCNDKSTHEIVQFFLKDITVIENGIKNTQSAGIKIENKNMLVNSNRIIDTLIYLKSDEFYESKEQRLESLVTSARMLHKSFSDYSKNHNLNMILFENNSISNPKIVSRTLLNLFEVSNKIEDKNFSHTFYLKKEEFLDDRNANFFVHHIKYNNKEAFEKEIENFEELFEIKSSTKTSEGYKKIVAASIFNNNQWWIWYIKDKEIIRGATSQRVGEYDHSYSGNIEEYYQLLYP